FKTLYGVEAKELNEFAIDCCEQQIEGVYGVDSEELEHFWAAVGLEAE
ncbi:MAG: YkgJ family cysteine cluster protein, partial [Cyanobacteria bacterium Co-bin13]|nr:YkgJ family cysteine cluster protein [Cyanobacteria bacterium Co-bin13]